MWPPRYLLLLLIDNLDISLVITTGFCVLGGLGRFLFLYAKNNLAYTRFTFRITPPKAKSNVGPNTPDPESGLDSLHQNVTSPGPAQNGSGKDLLDSATVLILPDGTWLKFFASPLFGKISETVLSIESAP